MTVTEQKKAVISTASVLSGCKNLYQVGAGFIYPYIS